MQQLPGVHRNPPVTSQHLAPRPHWKSLVQEPQWLFPQTYPAVVQSLFAQQLPAKHWPVQHFSPAPQSRSWLQAVQALLGGVVVVLVMQAVCDETQSVTVQQLPGTQVPPPVPSAPQHFWPLPHWTSVAHEVQAWLAQT